MGESDAMRSGNEWMDFRTLHVEAGMGQGSASRHLHCHSKFGEPATYQMYIPEVTPSRETKIREFRSTYIYMISIYGRFTHKKAPFGAHWGKLWLGCKWLCSKPPHKLAA